MITPVPRYDEVGATCVDEREDIVIVVVSLISYTRPSTKKIKISIAFKLMKYVEDVECSFQTIKSKNGNILKIFN